jgi:hypothetical protein
LGLNRFPANPAYGTGFFRRAVTVERRPGAVLVRLDDTHHAIWLLLEHDQGVVSNIIAGLSRAPTSACPASAAGLQALRGQTLAVVGTAVLPHHLNCTHLVDLARLALTIAGAANGREVGLDCYRIVVPDEKEGKRRPRPPSGAMAVSCINGRSGLCGLSRPSRWPDSR